MLRFILHCIICNSGVKIRVRPSGTVSQTLNLPDFRHFCRFFYFSRHYTSTVTRLLST